MRKKITAALTGLLILLSLAGCSPGNNQEGATTPGTEATDTGQTTAGATPTPEVLPSLEPAQPLPTLKLPEAQAVIEEKGTQYAELALRGADISLPFEAIMELDITDTYFAACGQTDTGYELVLYDYSEKDAALKTVLKAPETLWQMDDMSSTDQTAFRYVIQYIEAGEDYLTYQVYDQETENRVYYAYDIQKGTEIQLFERAETMAPQQCGDYYALMRFGGEDYTELHVRFIHMQTLEQSTYKFLGVSSYNTVSVDGHFVVTADKKDAANTESEGTSPEQEAVVFNPDTLASYRAPWDSTYNIVAEDNGSALISGYRELSEPDSDNPIYEDFFYELDIQTGEFSEKIAMPPDSPVAFVYNGILGNSCHMVLQYQKGQPLLYTEISNYIFGSGFKESGMVGTLSITWPEAEMSTLDPEYTIKMNEDNTRLLAVNSGGATCSVSLYDIIFKEADKAGEIALISGAVDQLAGQLELMRRADRYYYGAYEINSAEQAQQLIDALSAGDNKPTLLSGENIKFEQMSVSRDGYFMGALYTVDGSNIKIAARPVAQVPEDLPALFEQAYFYPAEMGGVTYYVMEDQSDLWSELPEQAGESEMFAGMMDFHCAVFIRDGVYFEVMADTGALSRQDFLKLLGDVNWFAPGQPLT